MKKQSDEKNKGDRREIVIEAEVPRNADISEKELEAIMTRTENEIIDTVSGDRAAVFLKIKAKEVTEIAKTIATEKTKVF